MKAYYAKQDAENYREKVILHKTYLDETSADSLKNQQML